MLQYLHIENIAVIEQANIEFSDGFNVMTGETGAGKSIIIDSLFAILGERTSRELIRLGCEKAVVSASFVDVGKTALEKLEELGFGIEKDEELIIQRVLHSDGRGQVKINSQPANVSTLKEIGKLLINIHGQHDNQNLLNAHKHMSFIDAFADNNREKTAYLSAFENFKSITKQYNSVVAEEEEKKARAKLLRYQIDELEKAEISVGEAQRLKSTISLCQQSERIITALNEAYGAINGNDDPENLSAIDLIKNALRSIGGISEIYPKAKETFEAINTLVLDLEGIATDISSLSEEVDLNPEEFLNAQNRLDTISDLMLKYGNTEDALLEYLGKAQNELSSIEQNEQLKSRLEGQLEPAQQALIEAGEVLSVSRKKAAKNICEKITEELVFLDFSGAKFTAEIEKGKYTKNGCDYTEFMISTNVGEETKPLVKVASGGELSRIMLAIKSIMAERDEVNTLIFDEIDTGISGRTAERVGKQLKKLSESHQIICVTHLSQIAAAAGTHMLIEKSVAEKNTYTTVRELKGDDRVREIARIMSGSQISDSVLSAAREMLSNS